MTSDQGVQAVLDVLDRVSESAKSIPPVDNKASRFGNPAFRTFYDKVQEVRSICKPAFFCPAVQHLVCKY